MLTQTSFLQAIETEQVTTAFQLRFTEKARHFKSTDWYSELSKRQGTKPKSSKIKSFNGCCLSARTARQNIVHCTI